jgi:hypothetical protein
MSNQAKVVVAYLDGRRLKGYTNDFSPLRDHFFLFPESVAPKPGARGIPVRADELKAVFFVKDFAGKPGHREATADFRPVGKRIGIIFADGEKLIGSSVAYNPKSLGFFMQPANSADNNERIFVINQNIKQIKVL